MGLASSHKPVLLITAVVSRYDSALEWARSQLAEVWGPVWRASPAFEFTETSFYEAEMGTGLKKQFLAFENLVDPGLAADHKILTNQLEVQYAEEQTHPESRPLNLDPGYISEAKLVLSTTKDRDHRIYLRDGIFAEVTLHYQRSGWAHARWTYPDYQRADFQEFFTECRTHLRTL